MHVDVVAFKASFSRLQLCSGVTGSNACPSSSEDPRPVVSLDMRSMERLLWIRPEDRLACVEAGITGSRLKELLAGSLAESRGKT